MKYLDDKCRFDYSRPLREGNNLPFEEYKYGFCITCDIYHWISDEELLVFEKERKLRLKLERILKII
jgi:hypothetical protein